MAMLKFRGIYLEDFERLAVKDPNTRYLVLKPDGNVYGEYIGNKLIGTEEITAERVKQLYEENENTNTFTDLEKVKLSNIEAGAEVNEVNSVNGQTGAVELDAEDVGALPDDTPIPAKVSDLENDEGFVKESDLETTLLDYVEVEAGKGLSANDYTNTDKDKVGNIDQVYTSAEKTKLSGIETGAQKNVGVEFTQTEKTKLSGIETGAQKNVGVEFTQSEKSKLAAIEQDAQKNTVNSVNGKTGTVVIDKSDVGLGNVTNDKQFTREEFEKLNLIGVKNLGGLDLTGKEYLGDGVYRYSDFNGITVDYEVESGIFTFNGSNTGALTISLFIVEPDTEYTVSYMAVSGSLSGGALRLHINSPVVTVITQTNQNVNKQLTFTSTSQTLFEFNMGLGRTFTNYKFKLQLEKGSTATDYQVPIKPIIYHETKHLEDQMLYENLLLNSNFDGLEGWSASTGAIQQPEPNVVELYFSSSVNFGGVVQTLSTDFIPGRKYYIRALVTSLENIDRAGFAVLSSNDDSIVKYIRNDMKQVGLEQLVSGVVTLPSGAGKIVLQLRGEGTGASYVQFREVMLIDITDIDLNYTQVKNYFDTIDWVDRYIPVKELLKKMIVDSQSPKKIQRLDALPLDRNKFDEEVVTLFKYDTDVEPIGRNYLREDHDVIFEGNPTWALEVNNSAHANMRFNLSVNDLSSYDYIDIYLHIDDINNMGASQIDLITGSSVTNKYSNFAVGSNLALVSDSGWRYLRIKRIDMQKGGTGDWTNITNFRITSRSVNTNTVKMNIGKIEAVKTKRGAVYMHFDDGTAGQYDNAFRIMEKYGLRGTISVITNNIGADGWVTWNQLREMEKAGWIVCSHTHTHKNLRELQEGNINELIYELETSQKELFDRGFYFGSKCLVTPFGGYNEKVDEYAKKYYAIVRTNNTTNRTNPSFVFPQSHHRSQYYLSPYNTDTAETIKGWIDNIIATKKEISIAWHRIEEGNESNQYNNQPAMFEEVCAYLKEKQDNGEIYVLNWLDSMLVKTMNPIDSEGLEYIVSDEGDAKVLRLPVEVDTQ